MIRVSLPIYLLNQQLYDDIIQAVHTLQSTNQFRKITVYYLKLIVKLRYKTNLNSYSIIFFAIFIGPILQCLTIN